MSRPDAPAVDEPALHALERLVTELDRCAAELQRNRERAEGLIVERRAGRRWVDIVDDEDRPLIVESVSAVLAALSSAGHGWRQQQALALQAEDVSINRIAAMFGVTRQRISTLLRESGQGPDPDAGTD